MNDYRPKFICNGIWELTCLVAIAIDIGAVVI
jgi:hypothetical protein